MTYFTSEWPAQASGPLFASRRVSTIIRQQRTYFFFQWPQTLKVEYL